MYSLLPPGHPNMIFTPSTSCGHGESETRGSLPALHTPRSVGSSEALWPRRPTRAFPVGLEAASRREGLYKDAAACLTPPAGASSPACRQRLSSLADAYYDTSSFRVSTLTAPCPKKFLFFGWGRSPFSRYVFPYAPSLIVYDLGNVGTESPGLAQWKS